MPAYSDVCDTLSPCWEYTTASYKPTRAASARHNFSEIHAGKPRWSKWDFEPATHYRTTSPPPHDVLGIGGRPLHNATNTIAEKLVSLSTHLQKSLNLIIAFFPDVTACQF